MSMLCLNCDKHNWQKLNHPYCVYCSRDGGYTSQGLNIGTCKALMELPKEKRLEIVALVSTRLKHYKKFGLTREWNTDVMFQEYIGFVKCGQKELDIPPSEDTGPDQRYRQYESPKSPTW